MSTHELTAKQIERFDIIGLDKRATQATLKVALRFHSNTLFELQKDERELWNELLETHDLDPNLQWKTKKVDGTLVIVPEEEEGQG